MTLIKDSKQSRVSQYVRKTLAKKRLSVDKGGKSAGAEEKTTTDGGTKDGQKLPSSLQNYKVRVSLDLSMCSI